MRTYNNSRYFNRNPNINASRNKNCRKKNPNVHYLSTKTPQKVAPICHNSSCRCDKCSPTFRPNYYNNYSQCVKPTNYIVRESHNLNKCRPCSGPSPPKPPNFCDVPDCDFDPTAVSLCDNYVLLFFEENGECKQCKVPLKFFCEICDGVDPEGCGTAYSYDNSTDSESICFKDIPNLPGNNWGWC